MSCFCFPRSILPPKAPLQLVQVPLIRAEILAFRRCPSIISGSTA
jgi:hypothetical protein